nr:uncharacterized protein LOC115260349 [Aedes albopictus]
MVDAVETIAIGESACKLINLNVQSFSAHKSAIESDAVLNMADVLALTETCEEEEATTEVHDFICIAKSKRPNLSAGGVAIHQKRTAIAVSAIPYSVRKLCASYDPELDLADEYGDICAVEINIQGSPALLICIFISKETTIKQKKLFLARNLILLFNVEVPMVVTGNFGIDISMEENLEFVDFMKKYLRFDLASDPAQATTERGSCEDLTFTRNVKCETKRCYSYFLHHRPMLTLFEC